jgi:filamentous hemagglutinin
VSYDTGASFQPGVGERARADARIILEGIKNSVLEQRTKDANYVVWQKKIDQGSFTETLVMPSFHGPKAPEFKGPVLAQIPAGEFKTQIQTLSQQPGMGYLNDLAARSDVNWQPVQLAFNQWNYKQEGLTSAGAALLAAAVAWAMPVTGVQAANSLFGANLTGASAAMGNAAFMSLASTAAITFVNNKGNIGKTLEALAKSETVKGIIAAALTAGVMDKLNATQTLSDLSKKTGFSEKLTYNLINAGSRALTNTAINGGDLMSRIAVMEPGMVGVMEPVSGC